MPESTSRAQPPVLTVIGEALIDLVQHGGPGNYRARPGGSPFNVAVGLARLGHRTTLMARLADNTFGRMLRDHAAAQGIDLSCAPCAVEPTTMAVVSMDAAAQASYDFYLEGTADWHWTAAETARIPAGTAVLHFGSVASWTPPGSEHIHSAIDRHRRRGTALISYDPNVRPMLLGDPAHARQTIERSVSVAHVVKASREDLRWAYADTDIERISARWLELGAALVVITDGADGAHVFHAGAGTLSRPGREVMVRDTVGAGDAFTAGLLGALVRGGLHSPEGLARSSAAALAAAVDDAILVSALTCERMGADPPVLLPRPHLPLSAPLSATDLCFQAPAEDTSAPSAPSAPEAPETSADPGGLGAPAPKDLGDQSSAAVANRV
jgi:fructokinase